MNVRLNTFGIFSKQFFWNSTSIILWFWISEELPALSQLGGTRGAGCVAAAGSRLTHGTAAGRGFSPTHPSVLMNVVTLEELALGHPSFGTSRGCNIVWCVGHWVHMGPEQDLTGRAAWGIWPFCRVTHQDLLVEAFYQ